MLILINVDLSVLSLRSWHFFFSSFVRFLLIFLSFLPFFSSVIRKIFFVTRKIFYHSNGFHYECVIVMIRACVSLSLFIFSFHYLGGLLQLLYLIRSRSRKKKARDKWDFRSKFYSSADADCNQLRIFHSLFPSLRNFNILNCCFGTEIVILTP